MSTDPSAPLSVGIVSLGCAKNLVDTQLMAGVLLDEQAVLASDPEHADVVLINTCAFIQAARDEAAEVIRRACAHKAAGGCRAVVVAGCLAQRYRDRLPRQFPGVDAWLGLGQLEGVAAVIRQAAQARPRRARAIIDVTPATAAALYTPRRPTLVFTGGPFAYLKIAEGCNHRCAFCAIPAIRGRYRSQPLPALVDEARALLAAGMRELNLISQDSTAYGRDRRGAPDLAALLQALDGLEGRFWLRLLYGYPAALSDSLLDTLAGARHVVRYLDLPIQHSHPEMLRAMRRADTVAMLPTLPQRLRAALPGLTLRTTCLVGFPGESEAHFTHLLETVAAARFDHLGVFVYSPEEGTPGAALPGRVPDEVAAERRDRLLRLQQRIVRANNRALLGGTSEALLLRPAPGAAGRRGVWLARTPRQAPDVDSLTRVTGLTPRARVGDFVRVRLTGSRGYDLIAEKR